MVKEKLVSHSSSKLLGSKFFKHICNTLTSPPSEDDHDDDDDDGERKDVDMRVGTWASSLILSAVDSLLRYAQASELFSAERWLSLRHSRDLRFVHSCVHNWDFTGSKIPHDE
jgi:hypothetical protein